MSPRRCHVCGLGYWRRNLSEKWEHTGRRWVKRIVRTGADPSHQKCTKLFRKWEGQPPGHLRRAS